MTVREALLSWQALLTANQVVIHFAYALAFLLMGFSLLLESRRPSQLPLAHHLRFLGLFGVIYAVAIWGKVFIPIQAAFLPPPVSEALWLVDAALFPAAFALLFSFGLKLWPGPVRTRRLLPMLPLLLLAGWTLLSLFLGAHFRGLAASADPAWPRIAEALARYLLGVPGAVVSGLGLIRQRESLRRAGMEHLTIHTDRGGRALFLYVIVGGLLVDAAPIWPARVWNSTWFFKVTLVPVEMVRAGLGLVLAWSMVRLLELYDVESERRDEERRRLRAVVQERSRIARELHDGVLQSLFSVGLGLESLKADLTLPELEPQRRQVDELVARLGRISQEIRAHVAGLYRGESEDEPRLAWEELAAEFEQSFPVQLQLDVDLRLWHELPGSIRRELVQIAREAIRNGCEHGRASEVVVELVADRRGRARLEIRDNGRGVAPETLLGRRAAERGLGLRTMRERARLLGGEFRFESAPGRGAAVRVTFPYRQGAAGVAGGDGAVYGE
ncbi:MAG: hypothetical protein IMX00_03195 [Limnochordales bacterium]|nr:hypothetical protein [Limnochordales bacterium]